MAKAMTKSQIVGKLAEGANLPKKQIAALLEDLVQMAYKEAKNGFTIPGLGKLVLMKRKARMGRNPQTGEQIKIPARTVLKFRIAKAGTTLHIQHLQNAAHLHHPQIALNPFAKTGTDGRQAGADDQ